jgi:CHAT domain-containing protein
MKKIFCIVFVFFAIGTLKSQVRFIELKKKFDYYVNTGDRYNSLLVAKELVSSSLYFHGDTSTYYSIGLRCLGNVFYDYGELDSAIFYYEKSRMSLMGNNRSESVEYSNALNNIANVYLDMGNSKKAEMYFLDALMILIKIDADNNSFGRIYQNLGSFYHRIGNYVNAEKYYYELLRIQKMEYGENSIRCISALKNIAAVQIRGRRYNDGMENYTLMIKILSADKIVNHDRSIGEIYLLMAQVMYKINDLDKYLTFMTKSEDLLFKSCDARAFELGLFYDAKGYYYFDKRILDSAEKYYQKSVRIYEFHRNNFGVSDALGNLALIADARNEFDLAEQYYLKSIKLMNPAGDQTWTNSYSNLINLYNKFSEFDKAVKITEKALLLAIKNFGNSSEEVASLLNNFSVSLAGIGEDSLAYYYLTESVKLKEEIYGLNNKEYARGLWHLSLFEVMFKKYDEAEEKLIKSLNIYKEIKTTDCRHDMFQSYKNLIRLCFIRGDWKSGKKYMILAKNIDGIKGICHPLEFVEFVNFEIEINFNLGEKETANNLLVSNYNDFQRVSAIEFQKRTDRQQREFWLELQPCLNFFGWMSIRLSSYNPDVMNIYCAVELLRKYTLTNNRIMKSQYLFEKEMDLRSYNFYTAKINNYKSNNVNADIRVSYQFVIDSLEKRLTTTWNDYLKEHSHWGLNMFDVQLELENDEVVVDFVQNFDRDENDVYYSAFVYNKSSVRPVFLKLCKRDTVDLIIRNLESENFVSDLSNLYNLIWRPLEQYLSSRRVVYFSPIGELNNLAFRVLVVGTFDSAVKYLSDVHELRNFMTFSNLKRSKNNIKVRSNRALLIGAVDYNSVSGFESEISNIYSVNKNKIKYQGLPYLDGSAREIDSIDFLLSDWDKKIFRGKYASESQVINHVDEVKPSLIHIATHGYCEENNSDLQDFSNYSSDNDFRKNNDDMVRSGLVLSGGNFAWLGIDSLYKIAGFDGLLNSVDVSNLELFNSDLVVLSACKTGLGENYGSEGNYGLKRGLKLAGAENLIVTLWPIDDDVSILFFTSFYRHLFKTLNINKSYNFAMLELRKKFPNSPYLWGAFDFIQ